MLTHFLLFFRFLRFLYRCCSVIAWTEPCKFYVRQKYEVKNLRTNFSSALNKVVLKVKSTSVVNGSPAFTCYAAIYEKKD